MTNRRFPVAGTKLTIPWAVAERALAAYKRYVVCGSTLTLEKVQKGKGGFTEEELDEWAPGWREQVR